MHVLRLVRWESRQEEVVFHGAEVHIHFSQGLDPVRQLLVLGQLEHQVLQRAGLNRPSERDVHSAVLIVVEVVIAPEVVRHQRNTVLCRCDQIQAIAAWIPFASKLQ